MPKVDLLLPGFSLGTDQGNVAFCGVTLIEGTKRILVDGAHVGRRNLLVQKLKDRGLTPDDIDYVFLTHAHWDHMLNVDVFPNARILISQVERDYIRDPHPGDWATPRYATLVLEAQKLQEVREGEELDEGVSVISTPGHSPGSQALLVRNGDEVAAVCGDALPNGLSVRTGLPRLVFYDLDSAKASIRRLLDTATVFYPGHDRPFTVEDAGHVRYTQQASIRVFGWPEGDGAEGGMVLGYGHNPPYETGIHGAAAEKPPG
jgi:glyoxylase-like metal-dependent hydrolase (beta-lactamase superfamily II)